MIKQNTKYEILTPDGFKDFLGIRTVEKSCYLELHMDNNKVLKCSEDHPFFIDGIKVLAKRLLPEDYLNSVNGDVFIKSINKVNNSALLYDVVEVADGNIFYANDFITHNCDFLSSGRSVIHFDVLKTYSQTVSEPIEKRGIDKEYWIWKYPDYSREYIVVADVARGDGQDFSAFHVIDVESIEQVAEYKGKMSTKDYGNLLVNAAQEYNDALLVIENANIGWAVIQTAIDREYKNLYYSYKDSPVVDAATHLTKGYDLKNRADMTPGFTTSSRTRPMIISKMELFFREAICVINSKRLLDELYVFIWNGQKAEAQSGYNDDLVMSFAIGLWVRDTAFRLRQEGIQLTKQSLSAIRRTGNESDLSAYSRHSSIYTPKSKANPWNMNVNGENMDLTWLV